MAPPFHADQIGSLLRPPSLLSARQSLSNPANLYTLPDSPALKQATQDAINAAIATQLSLSITPLVSGEYPRHIFYGGFFETLSGMTAHPDLDITSAFRTDFPTTTALAAMGAKTRAAVICTGPIRWTCSAYLEEWEMLISTLPEPKWKDCKITLPAPSYQHIQLRPGTAYTPESGYTTDAQYFSDLNLAYIAEIRALYAAGCRNIQIDDPHLTYFCSSQFLGGCAKDGTDASALLDLYLAAHNMFLRHLDLPADLHLGTHLCRGNMSGSKHWVSGSYDAIAEKLFSQTDYQTYYLEFDDAERQGDFSPLQYLPKGKNVVLGLISTKRAKLEDIATLKGQVAQAADVIAGAQGCSKEEAMQSLALSPQCGFSSSSLAGGKDMSMERMWEKLVLVRDAARKIWGEKSK